MHQRNTAASRRTDELVKYPSCKHHSTTTMRHGRAPFILVAASVLTLTLILPAQDRRLQRAAPGVCSRRGKVVAPKGLRCSAQQYSWLRRRIGTSTFAKEINPSELPINLHANPNEMGEEENFTFGTDEDGTFDEPMMMEENHWGEDDDSDDNLEEVDDDEMMRYESIELLDGPAQQGELQGKIAEADLVDIGVTIHIASSIAGDGLGMFVSTIPGVMMAVLPSWSILCGYALGELSNRAVGDKAVAFSFNSPENVVLWEGKPHTLGQVLDKIKANSSDDEISMLGHDVSISSEQGEIFVPQSSSSSVLPPNDDARGEGEDNDNNDVDEDISWQTLGQYCNDLALPADTKAEYMEGAKRNSLNLLYNVKLIDGQLTPVQLVCVTTRDLRVENTDPIEIGCTYGWGYWQAQRLNAM
eukprot:jgi/Bigna1/71808/fgenesh1_pg.17_\